MKNKLSATRPPAGPEAATAKVDNVPYMLRLYVAGAAGNSHQAIVNVRKLCEEHLQGRYNLEIRDISQRPILSEDVQIHVAPTLIRLLPLPVRRYVGNMAVTPSIMLGFEVCKTTARLAPENND